MHAPRRVLTLVLPLMLAKGVMAQAPAAAAAPPADQLQKAAAAFNASNWQGAYDAYTALSKQYPAHPLSRFRGG